jgi:transcriptional regulator with XRE-family HTH domain
VGLNENIRYIRKVKGFSQEYMAEMLCIHQSAYSRIENSEQACIERLPVLCKILGVTQNELIDYKLVRRDGSDFSYSLQTLNEIINSKDRIIAQRDEEIGFLKSQILLLKNIWDSHLKTY